MNECMDILGKTFEQTLRIYSDMVTKICILHCGNFEDAKDCFQNTFLKLYINKPDFNSENHLKAWLIQVAIHQCIDFKRQFWKRKVDLKEFNVFDQMKINDDTLLYEVMKLPIKYRQIIYLYYYEEYSTNEIAGLCGENINTIKSRLSRGRKKLKDRLGDTK